MKTIKVSESDFEEYEYSLKVVCPYCGNDFFFYEYQKWIEGHKGLSPLKDDGEKLSFCLADINPMLIKKNDDRIH